MRISTYNISPSGGILTAPKDSKVLSILRTQYGIDVICSGPNEPAPEWISIQVLVISPYEQISDGFTYIDKFMDADWGGLRLVFMRYIIDN